ncbi:flagellar hook-length control protein FliK [Cohnella caldifontis]|uniref:flagellar hook-length control protein FliK n=1 Tax=Cohnella caldifontis TaxID=3027471 RepID=UPI0023ED5017|nr:flagellar hook-length control protein FliK [Cohnella sp. YIM B05605]
MNANGIAIGGNASAKPASVGTAAAAGKTGAAGGFMGMLVQVIEGGSPSGANAAAGNGMTAGLAGLLSLLGGQGDEQASPELQDLLASLNEQLGHLDPNVPLPDDLQNQLAALLLLVQNLLTPPDAGVLTGTTAAETKASDEGMNLKGTSSQAAQPIVMALQKALTQLGERLSGNESLQKQTEGVIAPFKQALEVLQAYAARPENARKTESRTIADSRNPVQASKDELPRSGGTVTDESAASVEVQPEIRRSVAALRNPAWTSLTHPAAAETASAEGQATQATAAQPAETTSPNGSIPVWTLLKADAGANPAAVTPNGAATATVPVRQFAEEMGKFLVKQFTLSQGNGIAEAKISLHPEHLGQVDIKLQIHNGQLTAHFITENGTARDLLENQLAQLRAALQNQGLQVEKMEVSQQSTLHGAAAFFQQPQGRQGSGQQGGGAKNRNAGGSYDDSAGFEAELDRTAYLREIGYGASLNVTA